VRVPGGEVVIPFIEKTWFLWWIVSTLVILRWQHLFLSCADDSAVEGPAPSKGRPCTASDEIPRAPLAACPKTEILSS
jgi:hypothetical protein